MTDEEIDSFDAAELDSEDRETLRNMVGAILCETSAGFVSADIFTDADELEREWATVLAETEDTESDD